MNWKVSDEFEVMARLLKRDELDWRPGTVSSTTWRAIFKLTTGIAAYKILQEDGTITEDLGQINEGLGQTHRARLLVDDSVSQYEERKQRHTYIYPPDTDSSKYTILGLLPS